jgi:hypothetical protein
VYFLPDVHFEQKGDLENACAYTSCGSVFAFDCIVKKKDKVAVSLVGRWLGLGIGIGLGSG